MRIHLESDLHLEVSKGNAMVPNVSSDVCVCAGDIGTVQNITERTRLKEYFKHRKSLAEHVIWVLGNHEFYESDYYEGLEECKRIADQTGVILMDEAFGTENLEIDGVTFWGSTLWSDLHQGDWFASKKAADGINDFYVVRNGERRFSTALMREINARTREKINWDADVVITHFAPALIKHPRYPINELTYYFCNTGLDEKIMESNIKYWLYGHTHHSEITDLEGTLVISNQHGYRSSPSWSEETGFDPSLILEI